MNELVPRYEISRREHRKDAMIRMGMWSAPILVPAVPAAALAVVGILFAVTPPVMAVFLTFAVLWLIIGLFVGLGTTAGLALYRSRFRSGVRERIARRGIVAHEVDWFKGELTSAEKRALKEISAQNEVLADAYRETLAARLTATRLLKSSRSEQSLVKRRQNKVRMLKSDNVPALIQELEGDLNKLLDIERQAKEMLDEAQTRLQMIEATARRGSTLADAELATKSLSTRTEELPLALEAARMEEEIRKELEG